MTTKSLRPWSGGTLGLAMLIGGCAVPPQAPIELNVTIREAGICCLAGNLIGCHDRTADIKAAYADPNELHHTLGELARSDFDRPDTVEMDRADTVEHDRGDTVEHDLIRCKFRNDRLRAALEVCRTDWNKCHSDRLQNCDAAYSECYGAALLVGPFDNP
jgi:hypothetical protein